MKLFSRLSQFISPFVYLFVTPPLAFADTINVSPRPVGQFGPLADIGAGNFGAVVGRVVTIAFVIAVVIALIFLVYGGVKWITSGGDKTAVESARNTIVAAVIGLVVVFLSYFILNILLGFFNISLGSLQLPTVVLTTPAPTLAP